MSTRLIFNAFCMNALSHVYHGFWRHPDSRQVSFNDLSVWTDLAKILESARFDGLFLADVMGVDPVHAGSRDIYIEQGIHFPSNDPSILVAALAGATEHLGLMFTSSIIQAHPVEFARRVSTLDHYSRGRIGWNIVTSANKAAADLFGHPGLTRHDERYAWAQDYVDATYKLWEGSWQDDALLDDPAGGRYADPARVHDISHDGPYYRIHGVHMSTPSPQRTPVLIQAGSSVSGRAFAAANAEATFIVALTPDGARRAIADINRQLPAFGRKAGDVLFFQGLSFVIGSTDEEAARKARDMEEWVDMEALSAHVGRDLGVDFARLDPDQPVRELDIQGLQGFTRFVEEANPGKVVRLRDLSTAMSYNGCIVGSPETIANLLTEWRDAGIDGVNIAYQKLPGSFADFAEHVMPVLRERGLAQQDYAPGTLREKLFPGSGPRLGASHPGRRGWVGSLRT